MAERHGTWQATRRCTPPVDVQLITAGFLAHESLQPSSLPTPQRGQWHKKMAALRLQLRGQRWHRPTSHLAPDIGSLENRNATECSLIAF